MRGGDYKLQMGDHLEYRYEVLSVLGKGSFGQVLKCFDHKKDMLVALKMIRNKKRFHHQALVEVKILEHLMAVDKEHRSNIVRVHGYFYFRNHLCIAFEPLSINLYEFIKNNHFQVKCRHHHITTVIDNCHCPTVITAVSSWLFITGSPLCCMF